jgi:hypothetical protein
MPAQSSAKIEIEGQSDALRLTAEDASIDEVLAALSAKCNLTYSSEPELDRIVVGSYSGTLQQVVGRILEGYDYVVNVSVERIELKILSRSASVAKTLDAPAAAAQPTSCAHANPCRTCGL